MELRGEGAIYVTEDLDWFSRENKLMKNPFTGKCTWVGSKERLSWEEHGALKFDVKFVVLIQ